MSASVLICTCGVATSDYVHEDDCDLWLDQDYWEGQAYWDGIRLVKFDELDDELNRIEETVGLDEDYWIDEWGNTWLLESPHDTAEIDAKYKCTCWAPGEQIDHNDPHAKSCQLRQHWAWCEMLCEWDHESQMFLYYPDKKPADCTCPPTNYVKLVCYKCNVERSNKDAPWRERKKSNFSGSTSSSSSYGFGFYGGNGCTHSLDHVEFPDGTKIRPVSKYASNDLNDSQPDLALYLDDSWRPRGKSIFIPWIDHGLPTIQFHVAAATIVEVFEHAKAGFDVEVGCIGAHGRTGTALACMAVIAGVEPDAAVAWVRAHHCSKAVESSSQEWFVLWFAAWWNGEVAPPMPPKSQQPEAQPPCSAGTKVVKPIASPTSNTFVTTTVPAKDRKDLMPGDSCPFCPAGKHGTLGFDVVTDPSSLYCDQIECDAYDLPLERCGNCGVHLDAHSLEGFMCWNTKCERYHISLSSPKAAILEAEDEKKKK